MIIAIANIVLFGYLLELISAYFLVRGLVHAGIDEIYEESRTQFRANQAKFKSDLKKWIETITGFLFFVLGFLLQLVGVIFEFRERPDLYWVFGIAISTFLLSIIIVSKISSIIVFQEFKAKFGESYRDSLNKILSGDHPNASRILKNYETLLGVKRKAGERDNGYAERSLQKLGE